MAETIAQEQRRTKPVLEDFIATHISDETRKDVSAFLDYCKAKKTSYPWSSTNTWTMKAKAKSIGLIWIGGVKAPGQYDDDTRWAVGVGFTELLQYDDFIINENLESVILNSVICTNCNTRCAPGYTGKVLGKEYHNVKRCMWILDGKTCINFKNPDAAAIEKVKRIIDFRLALSHGTANRPIFDPGTKGLIRIDNKLRVSGVSDLQGNPFPGRPNEKIDNLFDGKYTSYADLCNHDIVFQLDAPAELVMYGLVTGHRLDVPDRWRFYGAASKSGPWTPLDARDEFPRPVTNFTEKAFKIDTPGAYQFYRFTFAGYNRVLSQVHLYTR